jgi:hypothetical protein
MRLLCLPELLPRNDQFRRVRFSAVPPGSIDICRTCLLRGKVERYCFVPFTSRQHRADSARNDSEQAHAAAAQRQNSAIKVLIAGPTGAIGKPLLSYLGDAGHELFAVVRSPKGNRELAAKGAHEVVADALDAASMLDALRRIKRDVEAAG